MPRTIKQLKKILLLLLLLSLAIIPCRPIFAANAKTGSPKLANYYLSWYINADEAKELSKWDVLILDMEVQNTSEENLEKIREYNPNIIILAYVTSEEISKNPTTVLRKKLYSGIDDSWWLVDSQRRKISFWPGTWMLNTSDLVNQKNGRRWNDYLANFMNTEVLSTGLWDGVFYDNLWPTINWANNGNVDINRDGVADLANYLNSNWLQGTTKILTTTKALAGNNFLIVGNGHSNRSLVTNLNGMMFEGFPSPYEADGTWAGSIRTYLNDENYNQKPYLGILNVDADASGYSDYQTMRFGLASTLLGDGYFSFDSGYLAHAQAWWYDEYNVKLGQAQTNAYNLLDKNNLAVRAGLWRRDFDNGVAIVNSTNTTQTYVFKEEFEKIKGTQDPKVNSGEKVNWLKINPDDGIILLKINTEIHNDSFNNGGFVRIFNLQGQQTRNGFFAYKENYPGNTQILITDVDNDGQNETLVNGGGEITIYKNGQVIVKFKPYDGKFKGDISFAVEDLNGDGTKEIITGAGAGGGPHVRIFNNQGKMLTGGFFAYDKNFRGGVNVAVMDLNGDGTKEIITGAGAGGGPHVRIFSKDGKALGGFFAYDKNFKGGVSVAVGDVNNDGQREIITGAGPGGAPEVRVFNAQAQMLSKFLAYTADIRTGVQVMADDIDNQGYAQILVGTVSF